MSLMLINKVCSSIQPYWIVAAVCGLFQISCSESKSDSGATPKPEPAPALTITKGKVFEQTCAVCHGQNGEGNRELGAPSIGGMPTWYIKLQIEKFQKGYRGSHPEDIHGQQMRAIALMLDEESLAEAAKKAASLPRIPTTSTNPNPPNTKVAQKMFADKCMICHRWNGSGEVAFRSSPLWGVQDWYHAAQLRKYRDGWRGADLNDFDGPKMAVIASRLTDEEIDAMAAYLVELAHGDDPRAVMER